MKGFFTAAFLRRFLLCCALHLGMVCAYAHGDLDLSTLLKPDGTLDLTKGVSGSLNFKGFDVAIDPVKGPIFKPSRFMAGAAALADPWYNVLGGLNGPCYAIAVSGANVYVGGSFTMADTAVVRNIARWNGTNWSRLASGLFGECHALTVLNNGDVIAGGAFTRAGAVAANRIARWNNASSTWVALGAGLNNVCYALALNSNQSTLFAGGIFTQAGTVAANFVARLTLGSNTWSAMQVGLNGPCYALQGVGTDDVYVGGSFSLAGTVNANNLARWSNGSSTWAALGAGLNGTCYALAAGTNEVFIGGNFTTAGGIPANNVARLALPGNTWTPLGAGLNGTCYVLIRNGSWLYAGGAFTTAGGQPANNAARWDNNLWTPLGTGLDDECYALAFSGTGVYAGGRFLEAGGKNALRIAFSVGCTPATVDSIPDQELCHGFSTQPVNFTGVPGTGVTYYWTNIEPLVGTRAISTVNSLNIPSFVASNINVIPTIARFRVTPVTGPALAYITNTQGNSITIINLATNTVVTTIPATSPRGIAVSPNNARILIANQVSTAPTATVFDASFNTPVRTFRVGATNAANPSGAAINPTGTTGYITNPGENRVTIVDPVTPDSLATRIPVGTAPIGIAVTPDSSMVFVANNGSDNVSVIHPVLNRVVATIAVGVDPFGVAVTPDGRFVYVTNQGNDNVYVISTATYRVVDTIAVGTRPSGIAINPAGTRAYVANQGSNSVSVINLATNTVIGTPISVGGAGTNPIGVSVSYDNSRVVVANNGNFSPATVNASASIINTATNTVISTIVIGLSQGSYSLGNFITPGSCYGNGQEFTIKVLPKLRLHVEKDTTICRGDTIRLEGFGTAVGYRWSPSNSLSDSVGQAVRASPRVTTDYIVRAGNIYGCEGRDTVRVSVHQPIQPKCKVNPTVYLDANGKAVLTPSLLLDIPVPLPEVYQIIARDFDGKTLFDTVTCAHEGTIVKVSVTDLCDYRSCNMLVLVKDTLSPVAHCRSAFAACILDPYDPYFLRDSLQLPNAIPGTDNCGITQATWTDSVLVAHPCSFSVKDSAGKDRFASASFKRKWVFKDAAGNQSECVQTVYYERKRVYEIFFPKDTVVTCDWEARQYTDPNLSPYFLVNGRRVYLYKGVLGIETCGFPLEYSEQTFPEANGVIRILRKWTVRDTCVATGAFTQPFPHTNPRFHVQIINVVPDLGLRAICPNDFRVSTDSAGCCGKANLPDLIIEDYCSRVTDLTAIVTARHPVTNAQIGLYQIGTQLVDFPLNNPDIPDTLGLVSSTPCLPKGTHDVTYTIQNDRGASLECRFKLIVLDFHPPIVACDKQTVVGIGEDDLNDCYLPDPANKRFAGVAWLKAKDLDDGSYDECPTPLGFSVRRMAPYSAFIESLNKQDGTAPCTDTTGQFSEYARATAEQDSVKFYCGEIGSIQTVVLRVYQLDDFGQRALDTLGNFVFNECMVQVEVQDKLSPRCVPPPSVTISCANFDPSLGAYGEPLITDNCCLDTIRYSANYERFDTLCNRGMITRLFLAEDCGQRGIICTQRIVVEYQQGFAVRFPDDRIITQCGGGSANLGEPLFWGEVCETLAVSFRDDTLAALADTCYTIERNWKIINWCAYDPNLPLTEVPNPNPRALPGHPDNLRGPVVSPPGAPPQWSATKTALSPGNAAIFDYGTLWSLGTNGYVYKQIIKVADAENPVAECLPLDSCDLTPNDSLLWNTPALWDAQLGQHDLCEGPQDLRLKVHDACSGARLNLRFLLYLDLDGNGQTETRISSTNLPQPGTVLFGNINGTGTALQFDRRPVTPEQKYRFAVQETRFGDTLMAALRWNTPAAPGQYRLPELPYGKHKIEWIASDGCGNETSCLRDFVVKDCKKPTVVCKPLSVNIMETGMVTLWASDFLEYADDNCTPPALLNFAIERDLLPPAGFPLQNGLPLTSLTFDCDDLGAQVVRLWVRDAAGNADFCATTVLIQESGTAICGQKAAVAGQVKTELGQGVEEADVTLTGSHPAFFPIALYQRSSKNGDYMFSNAIPLAGEYRVTPLRNDNPLNGVTTLDLALIQKHILGTALLPSPYHLIAADANRSGTVTSFDVVELRKLVLGIYDTLPNNKSWRFVDKSFVFPNPANPFQTPFPESKSVANVLASQLDNHFVGIKIGDVNATATANSLMQADDRSQGVFHLQLSNQTFEAGTVFETTLQALAPSTGFQFTLQYAGLELLELKPQGPMSAEHFALFPSQQALTCSWNATEGAFVPPAFTLRFRALRTGRLDEALQVSSRITHAEAYAPLPLAGQPSLGVALRFASPAQPQTLAFELFQNQPNPFAGQSALGFYLPQAGEATLRLSDEAGRVLHTQQRLFPAGFNQFVVDAREWPAGVYFYTVSSEQGSGVKKMVVAERP